MGKSVMIFVTSTLTTVTHKYMILQCSETIANGENFIMRKPLHTVKH